MSGHYFGSVWYFLAAAAIIAIGWCTTNASGGIGPHGTNLPWVQKPIGASFGVCGGAGTGSARMCELSFLEFDCPGCAAMQENPRVVRQPALSWVYVGEGSCWACVVKLFEGWCFLLEIIVVTSSSDVSVGGHGWRSKLEEQEFGSEFAKCPPVSTAGSLCWQRQKTCQAECTHGVRAKWIWFVRWANVAHQRVWDGILRWHSAWKYEYPTFAFPASILWESGRRETCFDHDCCSEGGFFKVFATLAHLGWWQAAHGSQQRPVGVWKFWCLGLGQSCCSAMKGGVEHDMGCLSTVWPYQFCLGRSCRCIWPGAADYEKRCFVTAVSWQCFLVTFSNIGCAIDPCWRLGTVDACSAYALLACFFCGRFSVVAKLRPCYRLVLWGLLGNTCDWDMHHVYVSSLYWLATACAGFDLQRLHDSSCMTAVAWQYF